MTVSCRPATASDATPLSEVAAATFPLACPPGTSLVDIARFVTTVLSRERFVEYLADDRRVVTVATEDETEDLVGYSMLITGEPDDSDVARVVAGRPAVELSKFYLMPATHGTGAGVALMTATLDAAARTGAVTVWLGVNQRNDRANRFYEKNAFDLVGTKRFVVGDETHDDFVRERLLVTRP